ncbi:hypothetical protein GOM49_14605 [Clostridium bovifaecis]|uniref:Spore coat protein GerQ n=1 Tax=Clostridium bovifaecis TaxID=2184719 RepID=A0A6I6F4P8_9CLOT|nr:hypothetical protein GOM49_14605 [Clostridium bovifaecis]
MEDWLDFDYRQMPEVQNPMYGQLPMMPWCQQAMMPYQQMPVMPYQQTAVPTAPMPGAQMPTTEGEGGPDFEMEPGAPVQQNRNYLQGYLRTQLGKSMRVEFLIGTSILTDRVGTLVEVGIDHIALVPFNSNDLQIADLYSIKFVEVFGGARDLPSHLQPTTTAPR